MQRATGYDIILFNFIMLKYERNIIMGKPILTLNGLSKFYTSPSSVVVGLNNINLSFEVGEFVAVTGESGSGKSTLGHVLGGIIPYEGGELLYSGKPTSHFDGNDWEEYRRDRISFISQSYGILPGSSVIGNVITALLLSGFNKKNARKRALEILKKVELESFKNRKAAKLSSGQKQRLSIARALAKPSKVLIADEPTGNLDAKNSAEIIKLLAETARDRLVILITHEFSEAEDYATRKITLRDGKVVSDMPLRENYKASAKKISETKSAPAKKKRKKKSLVGYISLLQIRMRPLWTTVMLLFFVLTAFSVFSFLGSFIVALDDTPTKNYDTSAFRNGDPTRLVLARQDGGEFTEEDYRAIMTIKHTSHIERYGFIADMNMPYREGIDYRSIYTLQYTSGGQSFAPSYQVLQGVKVINDKIFGGTVPVLPEGEEFLTAGRLPEKFHEVVVYGGEERIGENIVLLLQDKNDWGEYPLVRIDVTVVGVTDFKEGIYVSDQIGRMVTKACMNNDSSSMYCGVVNPNYAPGEKTDIFALFDFNGGTFLAPQSYIDSLNKTGGGISNYYTKLIDKNGEIIELRVSAAHDSNFYRYFEFSENDFERLVSDEKGSQISLYMDDYAYTDRVLEDVRALGYIAISPYREGSTTYNAELYAQRTQTLVICAVVLVVLVALQVIVERAMFGMQTDSYRLLSDIGLLGKTATRSVYLQVFLFTVLGQVLGFGGVFLLSEFGIERVNAIMKYLPFSGILILSVFHIIVCMLTAVWIVAALRKNVFPKGTKKTDLSFEEIEEEEEVEA